MRGDNKYRELGLMNHTFAITPSVIAHLGEDQIKNENIALVELVKNSYDAQASFCKVEFLFNGSELSKITIADDGLGMDINTIENVWLVASSRAISSERLI